MATNPKALEKLVELLGGGREGYCPHLTTLPKGRKSAPPEGFPDNPIGLAAALDHMAQGGNIAIVGKDDDDLLMIDVDDPKLLTEPFPATLNVRTRRRTGYHQYYRTTDPRLKNANGKVTKDGEKLGEFRGHNYYLVAPGSFVDTKPEEVSELFQSTAGQYTIECERAPAFVKLEDLPKPYRDEAIRQWELAKPTKTEETTKTWTPPTASKYWTFSMSQLLARLGVKIYDNGHFVSPIHGGDHTGPDANCVLTDELMQCHRCAVYFNAQHLLAVKAGVFGENWNEICGIIGTKHKTEFVSHLDSAGNIKAWEYGKKIGLFPTDDPNPYPDKEFLARGGKKQKETNISIKKAVEAGFYDPKSRVADYDQFYEAIEKCVEVKNENGLWIIARAAKCFPDGHVIGLAKWAVAEALLAGNRFATQEIIEPLMFWYNPRRGVYQQPAETRIRPLIRKQIPDVSNALLQEVVGAIRDRTYREREDFDAPLHLICVKNGVLNLDTMELTSHTPEIIFLSSINAERIKGADCPTFKKFLREVTSSDTDRQTLEEYIGFCLWRRYSLHVILMLLGEGRNGKTTFLNVVRAWLGKDNYSARNLRELASQRFSMIDLYGKLANISGEQGFEGGASISMGTLKDLSGEEAVPFEPKFKGSVTGVNTAKLFFACNQLPVSKDETLANWSRWLLLMFRKKFERGKPETDENLIEKLTTKEELSGILNLAIEGLARLKKNHNFSYQLLPDDVRELWAASANPAHGFILENLELDSEANDLSCDDLYRAFRIWSEAKGIKPIGKGKLTELLKAELAITKYQKGKEQIWCWRGIRFKSTEEKEQAAKQATVDQAYP